MDDKQALEILSELPLTQYWEAFQHYNRSKDAWVINSLGALDPFKQPTEMARSQGVRIGVFFLEKEILELLEEKRKQEEVQQEQDEDKDLE